MLVVDSIVLMTETVDDVTDDVVNVAVEDVDVELEVILFDSAWRFKMMLPGPLMVREAGLDVVEQANPPVQFQLRNV